LRAVAKGKLPSEIANKSKRGFGIPVDAWVDTAFKANLRDTLLGPSSKLPEFFLPDAYQPMVKAFCDGNSYQGISLEGLYQRVIALLAVQLMLTDRSDSRPVLSKDQLRRDL